MVRLILDVGRRRRDVRWQTGEEVVVTAVARNRRKLDPFYRRVVMTDGAALRRRIWGFVLFASPACANNVVGGTT